MNSSKAPSENENNEIETDFSNLIPEHIDKKILQWLADDIPSFDVGGLVVGSDERNAKLLLKSPGVFAGKPFFNKIFDAVNCKVEWEEG